MVDSQQHEAVGAPLAKRLMAMMYDAFILLALSMAYSALATVFMVLVLGNSGDPEYQPMQHGIWFQAGWLGTIVGFFWFFLKRAGQTVGMRAWRLKVVSRSAAPLSHSQVLRRIVLAPLSLIIFGLGYIWILFNQDKLAWHDILSNSRIILTHEK